MSSSQKIRDSVQPLSSPFLQSMIYFDQIYTVLYFFLEGCIFFYKGFGLYYPSSTIEQDIVLLVAFGICEIIRLQMGSVGNKTESTSHIVWFLLVNLPAIAGYFYFLLLQTYSLMIELIMAIIGLIFILFELIWAFSALTSFKNFEKQQY
ncbi:transmembrane protein (macronuclear) [Tetrahymena thermophila SB210]|uniref:Transmembrane protein n=1 Tax=Tetrahymena thermophila (strain SB210) TaxID=312017 RepID=I7LXZ1_TETTS|nr:transmembrane protein [Tetrahymena thermophila SB210]EAS07025.1 transmembrane protein [Tetrahymena thermophila SB210]|eukprot:XP_001027267.1 transmembrane protein [Tetrahymena thermophila SB210]